MSNPKYRVGIVGCGRLGQQYAEAYSVFPDTEIAAIAEFNNERRQVVGNRFGVKALYRDAEAMLKEVVPDVVAVVTPTAYYKDAVIACAEAGVRGVSTDKPIAARLSDADEMIEVCEKRGVVLSGGNLQRAMSEVQQAGRRIREGEFGGLIGASVHQWRGEVSGGGCQHIAVLTLLTQAEVTEVMAWGSPTVNLERDSDEGLAINGVFRMSNGLQCPVFGSATPRRGVDVWSEDSLISWDWAPPVIYQGFDGTGARRRIDPGYRPDEWSQFYYLGSSIRSFLAAVETGSELAISGRDLRHALEVAIAAKQSARLGNVPIRLPLEDRSLVLYPSVYRWAGGDAAGRGQTAAEAAGRA